MLSLLLSCVKGYLVNFIRIWVYNVAMSGKAYRYTAIKQQATLGLLAAGWTRAEIASTWRNLGSRSREPQG